MKVIIENVAALRGNGLVTVLQDLWSLGYDAEWHIISARSIGSCHLRERIWIIAYPKRERFGSRAGYKVLITVHDEVVSEREIGKGSIKEFESIMSKAPAWANGFPIGAEAWKGPRYKK